MRLMLNTSRLLKGNSEAPYGADLNAMVEMMRDAVKLVGAQADADGTFHPELKAVVEEVNEVNC